MSIYDYTYEIIDVDAENKVLLIKYSAENYESVIVSARFPYSGEPMAEYVKLFIPTATFEDQKKVYSTVVPAVGQTGEISFPVPSEEETKAQNMTFEDAVMQVLEKNNVV